MPPTSRASWVQNPAHVIILIDELIADFYVNAQSVRERHAQIAARYTQSQVHNKLSSLRERYTNRKSLESGRKWLVSELPFRQSAFSKNANYTVPSPDDNDDQGQQETVEEHSNVAVVTAVMPPPSSSSSLLNEEGDIAIMQPDNTVPDNATTIAVDTENENQISTSRDFFPAPRGNKETFSDSEYELPVAKRPKMHEFISYVPPRVQHPNDIIAMTTVDDNTTMLPSSSSFENGGIDDKDGQPQASSSSLCSIATTTATEFPFQIGWIKGDTTIQLALIGVPLAYADVSFRVSVNNPRRSEVTIRVQKRHILRTNARVWANFTPPNWLVDQVYTTAVTLPSSVRTLLPTRENDRERSMVRLTYPFKPSAEQAIDPVIVF